MFSKSRKNLFEKFDFIVDNMALILFIDPLILKFLMNVLMILS